jgi:putative ABC transport system substrate-binding protein
VAARILGVDLLVLNARNQSEVEAAFSQLVQQKAGGLIVSADTVFFGLRDRVIPLAARHKVPTIYQYREFPTSGGLMAYGPSLPEVFRVVGVYAGRILKGEKPADLPVQQPTKFELVINLKTAQALGLTIPETLLATADEIIQ